MRGVIGGAVLVLGLVVASPALAAFPGANGLLAVQPVSGGGIVLVTPQGHVVRRICTVKKQCGTPTQPRWSPDGRAIVFAGPKIRIVYTDGSCMDCQFGAAPNPAFKPGGTVISFIQKGHVTLDGIDGLREPSARLGSATDAVWSATGEVAVVRDGAVWAGRPGKLRRVAPGSDPSWSPHGDPIAAVQAGWVVVVGLRDNQVRRLARGSAPAFSPDGRWIAFVGADHRLMIIAAGGGRPSAVGHIRGLSVDWQPKPRGRNPGCVAPAGSKVLARAPGAVVTQNGVTPPHVPPGPVKGGGYPPLAYMACLRADGRERLLERIVFTNPDGATWVTSAVVAGPYAALAYHWENEHYGGANDWVWVYDLRTGQRRRDLGGESSTCEGPECNRIVQVVLGSDGVSAARVWWDAPAGFFSPPFDASACLPGTTVCLAADTGGVISSSDPAAGAGSWSSAGASTPVDLLKLTCPDQSLCVGLGADISTSSDPGGAAPTWQSTTLPDSFIHANDLTCPTTTLCVVTRQDGSIVTSSNPTGGTAAWAETQIQTPDSLDGVVCTAEPRCFITDSGGAVFTSGTPTEETGAWTMSSSTPAFVAGACPTSSLCVTVGQGEIATTTAPDAAQWSRQAIADDLISISCPSSSLCVAVGMQGALYVSTDPAAGMWTREIIDNGLSLTSVSCASASLCVATDGNGHVVASTNPAGGPSAWTPALLGFDACTDGHACSTESIETSDKSGVHTVDSSKLPGAGPYLTGMTLNGDTLSWSHDGSPRSVTLTPP